MPRPSLRARLIERKGWAMRIFLIAVAVLASAIGGAAALAMLHGARPGPMPQITAPSPHPQVPSAAKAAPVAAVPTQPRAQIAPAPAPAPVVAEADPAPNATPPRPTPRTAARPQKPVAARPVATARLGGGADIINLSQMPGALADPDTDRMLLLPPATQPAPGANLRDPSRNWVIGVYR